MAMRYGRLGTYQLVVRYARQTWEAAERWRTCSWKGDLCDCVECPRLDPTPVTSHTHIQLQYPLYLQFTFDLLLVSWAVVICWVLRAIKLPGTRTFCKCAPTFFFFLCCNSSTWAYAASMLRFLYHTHTHTHTHTCPVGLLQMSDQFAAEASTYTTHNKHTSQTSMPSMGYEPVIPATKWLQSYISDCTATGNGRVIQ